MSVEKQDSENVYRSRYCGIADAHGLESFYKMEGVSPRSVFTMQMRAGLNRQRHAVYYEVELLPKTAERVLEILNGDLNKYMANGITHTKFAYALLHLKDMDLVPTYGVAAQGCSEHDLFNSWELIPNPRLDPYGRDYSDTEE